MIHTAIMQDNLPYEIAIPGAIVALIGWFILGSADRRNRRKARRQYDPSANHQ